MCILRLKGIEMSTQDDLAHRRLTLSTSKQILLERRLQRQRANLTIGKRPDPTNAPASFSQERLWFLDQLEPGNAMFTIPIATRIAGTLDTCILEQCLDALIERHETWRTTFTSVEGIPVQHIGPPWHLPLSIIDLTSYPAEIREQEALKLATQHALLPFDLARGPLVRALLLTLSPNTFIFVLLQHHIISDGWSVGILLPEIVQLYEAFSQGRPSPLPELPIQYADYAYWQQQRLQDNTLEPQLSYWKQQLAELPPSLELPIDKPRPEQPTFRGAIQRFSFPRSLTDNLREFCRAQGVTLFTTILSAFETLLHRYSGQTNLLIGTSVANRTLPELEKVVGFFVNTLILRNDLSGDPTFQSVLHQVRSVSQSALAHQEVPFERVVARVPHIQVLFIMQNTPRRLIPVANLTFERMEIESHTAKFDLYLDIEDTPDIIGFLEYNSDIFVPATIERLVEHFQRLLMEIVAQPARRLSEFSLLTAHEQTQLRSSWGSGPTKTRPLTSLHACFERQVAITPLQSALETDERSFTYQELNECANRLAHYLRTLGIGPDVPVVLCMERSIEQMIGVLGILKAGGCYVPLDPALPVKRLQWILADTKAPVILTLQQQEPLFATFQSAMSHVIFLDRLQEQLAQQPATNPSPVISVEQLAYIIYTSGSTGIPKGVEVPHRSVLNHSVAIAERFAFSSTDRVLQFASLSFDAAAEELYPTWLSGATLVLRPDYLPALGAELHQFISQKELTILNLPTAYWHQWMANLATAPAIIDTMLRLVIIGGEQAQPDAYRAWQHYASPQVTLSNTYGPTEATITATLYCPEPAMPFLDVVPIGQPLANTQAYILDQHLHFVPPGALGELYLGGAGVARGYLNQPGLTAERFVPDPYGPPGSRLYRTGDLASYLADGNLHYRGRSDQQVKIRGYRIELQEIEHVLQQHPAINECLILAREERSGNPYLVAYVTSSQSDLSSSALRYYLQEHLPDYMLPTHTILLEQFPLTSSGKVDRDSLPVPGTEREIETSYVPPRTALEEVLVSLWASVLNVEQIGVYDNFFEHGGHSLLATQLVARIQDIFPVELPLKTIFEHPTIAHLAQVMLQEDDQRETIELTVQLLQSVADLSDEEAQLLFDAQQAEQEGTQDGQ